MESFWERAREAYGTLVGRKSNLFDESLSIAARAQGMSWAGRSVDLQTALRVSVAFACGRVIAEGISMLPTKIMQKQGRQRLPATDHYLYDKFATAPNPLQTSVEFFETLAWHLAFTGTAYVWTPRVSRKIDAFYLLEPRWVTVIKKWPNLPTFEIQTDSGRISLTSDEVWVVRGPSWSTYAGLDILDFARNALGLSSAIEHTQSKFQSEGLDTSGFIAVAGKLSPEQHEKLKKWIEKAQDEKGRAQILDNGATWIQRSMSGADAQVLETRKFQIEEVCRFFRVMPIMVGYSDKTATYASAEQMFLAHMVHTIGPWLRRIEVSIDKNILTADEREAGYYANIDEKAALRMIAKDQMETLARGVLSGIILRNEARDKLDLNPVDGGDEMLTPVNTFVGAPPSADNSSPQNEPATGKPED